MLLSNIPSKLLLLGGLAALAAALPSSPENSLETETDACCCCDIGAGAISCTYEIPFDECVCLAVVCPDGAPTIWPDHPPEPTPTDDHGPDEEEDDDGYCCCCDATGETPVIACYDPFLKNDGVCICTLALCPDDAPTVYIDPPPAPTTPPPGEDDGPDGEDDEEYCCCCDASGEEPVISCQKPLEENDGVCICNLIACPDGAPTVYVDHPPSPTPPPGEDDGPDEEDDEEYCCCCDASGEEPVISCQKPLEENDGVCVCTLIACPDGAPTVYVDPPPSPTPPPVEEEVECCCCDISIPAISCKLQAEEVGCFCPFVLCPPDVPTVWPEGAPEPTPVPGSPSPDA